MSEGYDMVAELRGMRLKIEELEELCGMKRKQVERIDELKKKQRITTKWILELQDTTHELQLKHEGNLNRIAELRASSASHTEETEEEAQREADAEEAKEVAQYLKLTDSKPICPECESDIGVIPLSNGKWHCGDCNVDIEGNEKPPEPKGMKYYVDKYDEYWKKMSNQPLIPVEYGYKTFKRDPIGKNIIMVKREDLQALWNYIHSVNPTGEDERNLNRIKEAYGIE